MASPLFHSLEAAAYVAAHVSHRTRFSSTFSSVTSIARKYLTPHMMRLRFDERRCRDAECQFIFAYILILVPARRFRHAARFPLAAYYHFHDVARARCERHESLPLVSLPRAAAFVNCIYTTTITFSYLPVLLPTCFHAVVHEKRRRAWLNSIFDFDGRILRRLHRAAPLDDLHASQPATMPSAAARAMPFSAAAAAGCRR